MMSSANEEAGSTEHVGTGKDPSEYVLCYLTCPQAGSDAFAGALMLTDARTRPLHFGYVSPIKPTAIQRLLYGPTLREHVKIDVIVDKLLQGVPQAPDVVFVDNKELLTARRICTWPIAYLAKRQGGEDATNLSALVYETNEGTDDRDVVGSVVSVLESQIDLIEPFGRMMEALKEAVKARSK